MIVARATEGLRTSGPSCLANKNIAGVQSSVERYRIHADAVVYYLTYSVVEWLPVFVSQASCHIVTESLTFCHDTKHLRVNAYVIVGDLRLPGKAESGRDLRSGVWVYDPLGDMLAEMNGQSLSQGRVPLAAGAMAMYTSGPALAAYWHTDWEGSVRFASTPNQAMWSDSAFAPFGEQYAGAGTNWASYAGTMQNTVSGTYDADFRHYDPTSGRWLSPDPAGMAAADLTNPQSLNRYAYVLNNPTTLVDPKGLHFFKPCLTLSNCTWSGDPNLGGGGGGCTVDGISGPCSTLGQNGIAPCPNNECTTVGTDPLTGQQAILQFTAGAGGATGYLSTYDMSQGLNEVNGTFLSNTQYNSYIQATYAGGISAQRAALAAAIAGNSGGAITYQQAYDSLNPANGHLQGGNYNFGETIYGPSDLICGGDARCNGIHFVTSDNQTFFHLDTANPWASPFGLVEHAFVDVFLGNFAYTVIPRPWP